MSQLTSPTAGALLARPGLFAQKLVETPAQTLHNNDLPVMNDSLTPCRALAVLEPAGARKVR